MGGYRHIMDITCFPSFFNIIYLGIMLKLDVTFKQHSLFDVNRIRVGSTQHDVALVLRSE
jgi:hypothetical protein